MAAANRPKLIYIDAKKRASMTAESDAMLVGTIVNWMDVTIWRQAVDNRGDGAEGDDYRGPVEFDIRILSDAAETLAAVQLYGVFEENFPIAADVFTATFGTNTLTAAAHGLLDGDGPIQLTNAGGALPAGLAVLTNYWVIRTDANDIQLAATQADALQGVVVPFTDNGTGTHTWTGVVDANPSNESQRLHYALLGDLNDAVDIAVDAQLSYIERALHNAVVKYYNVIATGVTPETITVHLDPVYVEDR